MKKAFSILTILYTLAAYTLPFVFFGGLDDAAARYKNDGTAVYLDSEAIALADSSEANEGLRDEAIEAFNQINDIRVDEGLDALDWNQNLESVSDVRAEECSRVFSHTRPNNKPWYTVNNQIQGGENLAFGYDTADEAVDAWMDSTTHRDNILYSEFTGGSISIYQDDNGVCYWAHEFNY